MEAKNRKRIYLAGPDVFYPDAAMRGRAMVELCAGYGHQGIYPLDSLYPSGSKQEQACWIYSANTRLIDSCDLVIANLNPFRGEEPDSGTAFEVGYAIAKGKTVYGYLSDVRTQRARYGCATDTEGRVIEDFSLPINLMLGVPVSLVAGGLQEVLARINASIEADRHRSALKNRKGVGT
jgi:nucleoside 2-deoxyribosyltransferase